jgi:arylsulfatase A-like enzyme
LCAVFFDRPGYPAARCTFRPAFTYIKGTMKLNRGVFLLLLVTAWFSALRAAHASKPPNVIFILADDLGWGDLGAYGDTHGATPRLDAFAKQGTLFTNFYVNNPVCSPSRCGFFTGQYPARHRVHGHYASREHNERRGMSQRLDPEAPNVARALKAVGYTTGHIGKVAPGSAGARDAHAGSLWLRFRAGVWTS